MVELPHWPYIQTVPLSGELKTDITNFLTVNGKQETAAHCMAVAKTNEALARRFKLDISAASACALLHDISNVIKPQDMLHYAVAQNWALDEAERRHPFLLHQRLSAVFAQTLFNVNDAAVVSAIGCHTTLKAAPSDDDMALFLADKLSWDQAGTPPFFDVVSSALTHSLRYACLTYINFVLTNGMILCPHKWLMEAREWLQNG